MKTDRASLLEQHGNEHTTLCRPHTPHLLEQWLHILAVCAALEVDTKLLTKHPLNGLGVLANNSRRKLVQGLKDERNK